jgi:hypothetical protein
MPRLTARATSQDGALSSTRARIAIIGASRLKSATTTIPIVFVVVWSPWRSASSKAYRVQAATSRVLATYVPGDFTKPANI